MDRDPVILDQQGPLLCLHGSYETVFRYHDYNVDTMVVSDIDESERG